MRSVVILLAICLSSRLVHGDLIGLEGQPLPESESTIAKLEDARKLLANSQLEDCFALLQELAKSQPDLPHPQVILSTWLLKGGYAKQARELMERLSTEDSQRVDVRHWFALLAEAERRYFDAWSHLQLIRTDSCPETWTPDYRRTYLIGVGRSRARIAALRQDWVSASTILSKLLKEGSDDVELRLGLGQALFAQQDLVGAELQLRKAAAFAPKRVVPELALAELHDELGEQEEAEQWFLTLIDRTKKSGNSNSRAKQAVAAYASWLLRHNRPADVLQVIHNFSSSQETDSTKLGELKLLGAFALQMNSDFETSAKILESLSQEDPGNLVISNRLALALVESNDEGKRDRALQIAQVNAKLAPSSVNVACSLAWIQFRLGHLTAASRIASSVLQAGGQLDRDSAYFLSEILSSLGRAEEAAKLMELAANGNNEFYYLKQLAASEASRGDS